MQAFDLTFEELPDSLKDGMWAGSNEGSAEISYDSDGEWIVTDIAVRYDNRKRGSEIKTKLIRLSPSYDKERFEGMREALIAFYSDAIEARIHNELSEQGVSFKTEHDHQRSEFMARVM